MTRPVTLLTLPKRGVRSKARSDYNSALKVMPGLHYALVTYVRNPVGLFVEKLRQELHPTKIHLAAHLTILPPCELAGPEAAALHSLEEACKHVIPFDVELGDVETFLPT